MKVTVKDFLHVRIGKPSVNAATFQYLAPGSELEVDGQLYKGDSYEGTDTWLKDEAENYYWSGGVLSQIVNDVSNSDFWFEQLEMREIHQTERGDKSKVLILDSGINENLIPFYGAILTPAINFVTGSTTTRCNDTDCHGTHCAGLIAARFMSTNVGAAPESKLYISKVTEFGKLTNADTIKAALREFLKEKYEFDIISISQSLIDEDIELHELLQKHLEKNRLIVAAIGNDTFRKNSNFKRYPGFYSCCISVGSAENSDELSKYTCFPSKADIFCYGTNIMSYKQDNFPLPLTGTSQSTAIVAGICALIVSFLKRNNISYNQDDVKKLLKNYSKPLIAHPTFQLIQPKKIFEKLLTCKNNENTTLQNCLDVIDSING